MYPPERRAHSPGAGERTDYAVTAVDPSDLATMQQIHAVQLAAYIVESQLIEYPALPPLAETVADLCGADETFLVCWLDGAVVGATSFVRLDNGVDIIRLVVNPPYFGQGIGSRLLAAVETQCPQGAVISVSTAARNHPAIGLYEKRGYRIRRHEQLADGLRLVHLQKCVVREQSSATHDGQPSHTLSPASLRPPIG